MCAILGIVSHGRNVMDDAITLSAAQNHRGEQACGCIFADAGQVKEPFYGLGKVPEVFGERDRVEWSKLGGSVGITHCLYSTVGSGDGEQPMTRQPIKFVFNKKVGALSHNGNLIRLNELREKAREAGYGFKSPDSDSEVIAAILSTSKCETFLEALLEVLKKIEGKGSFSLVIMYEGKLYGIRDQNGNRPLCIIKKNGKNGDNDSYIFASETCVFTTLEATRVIRLVEPGELVVLGSNGIERSMQWTKNVKPAFCVNEFVYFAHPASRLCGNCSVYQFRLCAGRMLAKNHPVEADVIVAVPDSGRGVADGIAQQSGIVNLQGLIKNSNAGRTFMMQRHIDRAARQRMKLQAVSDIMAGKNVRLGEDSIFRSSVSKMAVKLCREHGRARSVGVGVGSPPVRWGCHLGIDVPTQKELVATGRTIDEIRQEINADSLEYLTIEELREVLNELGFNPDHFCMGCYTGEYPVSPL
ncbi:MAG: amidophosphoribosyltransferase [Candidatus Staskawiczbacteria bacterium]|nr:amidophosphoribosyltransferase [Candidatus Staskawiczbacteria bacterium]